MANIITISDFFASGQLEIPGSEKPEVAAEVNKYITDYQPEYLSKVLTYKLAKEFLAGLAETPTIDPKWTKLRDGDEFINPHNDQLEKYGGIKKPLAAYVYSKYRVDKATTFSRAGEVLAGVENSKRTSPSIKMSQAWSLMVDNNLVLWNYLYVNKGTYGLSEEDFYTCYWNIYFLRHCDFIEMSSRINEFDI